MCFLTFASIKRRSDTCSVARRKVFCESLSFVLHCNTRKFKWKKPFHTEIKKLFFWVIWRKSFFFCICLSLSHLRQNKMSLRWTNYDHEKFLKFLFQKLLFCFLLIHNCNVRLRMTKFFRFFTNMKQFKMHQFFSFHLQTPLVFQ